MRLLGILFVLTSISIGGLAQTNAPEVRKLSLEDCIQIALQHNLGLQIERINPELSRYALAGDYGSYEPNLNLGGRHNYNQSPGGIDDQNRQYSGSQTDANRVNGGFSGLLPWGLNYDLSGGMTDTYGTENGAVGSAGISLSQPLLKNAWIDNIRLQIILDKKSLKISELELRSQIMDTVTSVEEAYFDLTYADENVRVQQLAVELAERSVAENRKRVEVGALAPLDEKQAESQAAGSRADLLSAESDRGTRQRVLKALLSDDYSKWQTTVVLPADPLVATPTQFNLQESWRKGLTQRPEVLQQKLSLEKQGFVIRYRKNQLYPQLDLLGSYGLNAASSQGVSSALDQIPGRDNPYWMIGGQVTIPLGNTSAKNALKTARATKEQLALQLKQMEQGILIKIENAIAVAETQLLTVTARREARIYAEAALDAEQKKLNSGKSTSFEVLRLQRDLTSARSAEIRALADYNIALARVALNEGSTLERRHVSIETK